MAMRQRLQLLEPAQNKIFLRWLAYTHVMRFAERGLSACVLLKKNKEILDPYWIDVFQRICLPRSVNASLLSHICFRS